MMSTPYLLSEGADGGWWEGEAYKKYIPGSTDNYQWKLIGIPLIFSASIWQMKKGFDKWNLEFYPEIYFSTQLLAFKC